MQETGNLNPKAYKRGTSPTTAAKAANSATAGARPQCHKRQRTHHQQHFHVPNSTTCCAVGDVEGHRDPQEQPRRNPPRKGRRVARNELAPLSADEALSGLGVHQAIPKLESTAELAVERHQSHALGDFASSMQRRGRWLQRRWRKLQRRRRGLQQRRRGLQGTRRLCTRRGFTQILQVSGTTVSYPTSSAEAESSASAQSEPTLSDSNAAFFCEKVLLRDSCQSIESLFKARVVHCVQLKSVVIPSSHKTGFVLVTVNTHAQDACEDSRSC
jgi:hypothetical protein